MKLSSLSSIISAVTSAFNSEASSSKTQYHLQLDGFPANYLTFYDNAGTAELCESKVSGYRTFTFTPYPVGTFAQIPNDNNLFLDVIGSQPGAYNIAIGGTSPGYLSFSDAIDHSQAIPYFKGEYYQFFYETDTPIKHGDFNCYRLWIGNGTAYSYGWTSIDLYYS